MVDDKSYSQRQFQIILDDIGYPFTNPYHIIEQGKISEVAAMSPNELLELLKMAAGIKKYEQRIALAKKNIEKSLEERQKMEE